jgi:hypothetical protein
MIFRCGRARACHRGLFLPIRGWTSRRQRQPHGIAPDRLVTQLYYELSPSQAATAEGRLDLLSARFDAPDFVEREDLAPDAALSDRVSLYARWGGDVVTLGLGASRVVDYGVVAACLWVSWRTDLAARPHLEEWRRQDSEVSAIAARASQVHTFALSLDLHGQSACSDRAVALALSTPEILDTPPNIAVRLNQRSFALWSSAVDARWGASTRWDTISFAIRRRVDVAHNRLRVAGVRNCASVPGRYGIAMA